MDNLTSALTVFKELDKREVNYLILHLLHEEKIDIPMLVNKYTEYLTNFKHDAQRDIRNLAEAGLELGQQNIKKISSVKSDNKKQLHTALAHTLLTAGFRGTKFNEELSKYVDMSIVDQDWYENCWQLKTIRGEE